MKVLAIIPARGGSKGIRGKNMRLLNGKPLIWYVINTAKNISSITDLLVTSENESILDYVSQLGVKVHRRPENLAFDEVTLDPVIFNAYEWYKANYGEVDYVITIQPTSPLVSRESIEKAIESAVINDFDTVLSVVEDSHLTWRMKDGEPIPDFSQRLNRQYLEKRFKETGAFLLTKSEFVKENSRFGNKIQLFPIPLEEAIDIDTPLDWLLAESLLNKIKILIVTFANLKVGTGHFNRALSLADVFLGHSVEFVLIDSDAEFEKKLKGYGYKCYSISLKDVLSIANNYDIIINDILDTEEWYIDGLRRKGVFVVNFEDLSRSSHKAHLVFNDMYLKNILSKFNQYDYHFAVLKESFLINKPNEFNKKVRTILITFGGVDENNLTLKALRSISELISSFDLKVKVIIGPLYSHKEELEDFVQKSNISKNITILANIKDMSSEMRDVDVGITSNGRTVYEFASMRVPVISIAQNKRETLHAFAKKNKGVMYLGIASNVNEARIKDAVRKLVEDNKLRYRMYSSLPFKELRSGILHVKDEIIYNYWRWKRNEDKNRKYYFG